MKVLILALALILVPGVASADPISASIATSLVSAGLSKAVASFIASALVQAIGSVVLNAVTGALFGKKPAARGSGGFAADAFERTQVVRSSVQPMNLVYGETVVSGPLAFADTSGDSNEYLHLVLPVAAHEVEEIGSVYLNDTEIRVDQLDGSGVVTDGDYADKVRIKKYLGTETQTADADLVSECANWTTAHRLRGCAYLYVRLQEDRDVFATGIPNIKAVVKGKKLYDPRTGSTVWSDNAALIARDYLTDPKGMAAEATEIDDTFISAAANASDEIVEVTDDDDTFTADASSDTFTRSDSKAVRLALGDECETSSDDTLPNGLAPSTKYFYIPVGVDRFKLATSLANARAGAALSISDAGTGTHTVTKTGQVRYDCHGVVPLDRAPISVIEDLMTSQAGAMVYTQGVYRLYAGAATSASASIDETWLRGPAGMRPSVARSELFNQVRGTFVDPDRFWQPTDFPVQQNVLYERQDGGISDTFTADAGTDILTLATGGTWVRTGRRVVLETTDTLPGGVSVLTGYYLIAESSTEIKLAASLDDALAGTEIDITGAGTGTHTLYLCVALPRDIELPFTQDATRAQRIGKIHLERSRQGITLELPCNLKALPVAVWDTVSVTLDVYGFSAKLFRVLEWRITGDLGIDLVLQEEAASVYDWAKGEETRYDPAPDTALAPALSAVAPTGLTLSSGTSVLDQRLDGTIFSRIKLTWTAAADAFARAIEIQYKKSAAMTWLSAATIDAASTEAYILDVQDGADYDVRIRSVNSLGKRSAWATVSDHTVVGKTAPPSDVASFTAAQNGNVVTFQWSPIADLDRAGYEIRYMAAPFVWANAKELTKETKGTLVTNAGAPPGSWVFGIKAIDTSENESTNATTFALTVKNTFDVVKTIAEQGPRWPGSMSGFFRHDVSGYLIPESDTLAVDMSDAELWDQAVYDPVATCSYEFSPAIDLTFDADDVRVFGNLAAVLLYGEAGVADPVLQIDYRDDADSYDGFETWTVGTVDARHIKARAVIDTSTGVAGLSASALTADVDERSEGAQAVTVGIGGISVVFASPFHLTPAVEARAQPVSGAARHALITNVTTTGFDVEVVNASDTDVGGVLDYWEARGA